MLAEKSSASLAPFQISDRTPPHDLAAECELLGGVLLDPSAIERSRETGLLPEAFYLKAHQRIYEAMLSLATSAISSEPINVARWLSERGFLEDVGGMKTLVRLLDPVVSSLQVETCATVILDRYHRRLAIETLKANAKEVRDLSRPLSEVLGESEQRFYEVTDRARATNHSQAESTYELLPKVWDYLESPDLPSMKTDLYDFDAITGGLFPSELSIVAGRASMGKSHFGVSMALAIASIHNRPVVFFSCEMSKQAIVLRMLARLAMVDSAKLRLKQLTTPDWEAIDKAVGRLSKLPIVIHDAKCPSLVEISTVIRRTADKYGETPPLVILDYLQLLKGKAATRELELTNITVGCREIAHQFNLHFMALAQISRQAEQRKESRPQMSDLRESGSIEMTADLVALLYREEYYNRGTPNKGILEINLAKTRGSSTGVCKLLFQPEFGLFRNLSH